MNATATTENRPAAKQFATFTVGDLFFGVEVLEVQEVLRFHEMTPVPSADPVTRTPRSSRKPLFAISLIGLLVLCPAPD